MAAISGKVVIVTGASTGIGRAAAVRLAHAGCRLVLVARRASLLNALANELQNSACEPLVLPLDLRQPEDVKSMIERAHAHCGRIDVLINNAGFGYYGSVENTPAEVTREIFALNFDAVLFASQLVVPIMRRQGGGHIINISSVAGKRGLPLSGIYCATKFALNGISEAMRVELRDSGIHVSIVNPAATGTDFGENVRIGDVTAPFKAMGHIQSADEVAASIVHCIERPKPEVYPYRISRALVWMNAVAPAFVDKVMMRFFRERFRARASLTT